jgi:hypothetical protein
MALRLSQPAPTGIPQPAAEQLLPTKARELVAAGDLAAYRALFSEAAALSDIHVLYAVQ